LWVKQRIVGNENANSEELQTNQWLLLHTEQNLRLVFGKCKKVIFRKNKTSCSSLQWWDHSNAYYTL